MWEWIKKWKLTIIAGLSIALDFILGYALMKKSPDVPAAVDATDQKLAEETKKILEFKEQKQAQAEEEHEAVVVEVVKDANNAVKTLEDDPAATNDFLKKVGQDVRGP